MCLPCRLHHASVYDIFFGSTRCCLMQFMQRHGYASFTETNQGCLGCSASTSPVLVSLSLFQLDVLDAEDNGHAHILLVGCFCMLGGGLLRGNTNFLVGTC